MSVCKIVLSKFTSEHDVCILAALSQNVPSNMRKMNIFKPSYECVKYPPGPRSPFMYSSVSNDSVSREWRLWSDCALCISPNTRFRKRGPYIYTYLYKGLNLPLRKHAYSTILEILPPKNENFQIKISDIFHISAQNIDCGYSLEPPRRGGSYEYPQSMFCAEIRKIMYTPVNPSFTI